MRGLLWFSEADGSLVTVTVRLAGSDENKVRYDLIGMGSAGETRWGERPALAPTPSR